MSAHQSREHYNIELVDPTDVKSSKNETYINEATLLFRYATGKLIMWQLHLLNNIQNATYLRG